MQTEHIKLTDSLERELNRREIEAAHELAFTGLASGSLRRFLSVGSALGAAIHSLRRQARTAKVDYAAS
jgi:hypothetical protein